MKAATLIAAMWLGFGCTGATASEGGGKNWMRDTVRQREFSQAERIMGRRAAETLMERPKIIGGHPSPAGRWPFQVGILNAGVANNFYAQYCGGSLIAPFYVLTAAHCVDFLPADQMNVLTGTSSLVRGGKRHPVASVTIHPNWDPKTFDYDIAVLRLATPAVGIPTVRLLTRDDERQLAYPLARAMVIGWGDVDPGEEAVYPTQLRQVSFPIIARDICEKPYKGQITRRMICAGKSQGGRDTCQGDSGGPLLVKNREGLFVVQAGITSWGEGCALPFYFGVYSRIAVLEPWVRNVIAAQNARR